MKSIKYILFLLGMLLPLLANAQLTEIDGIYYDRGLDLTAQVTWKPGGYTGSIVIPETIEYENEVYTVTSIDQEAFKDDTGLTDVQIPGTVTLIGDHAFSGCTALSSIDIPEGVVTIESYAFQGCTALAKVSLPKSVRSIGIGTFVGSSVLNSQPDGLLYVDKWLCGRQNLTGDTIEIANGTVGIADCALQNENISSIKFPESLVIIGSNAFYNCKKLKEVVFPDGLKCIEGSAFWKSGLENISLPTSLEEVESGAFSETPWLNSQPNGLVYAGNWLLLYKSNYSEENLNIDIKEGITHIADGGLSGLKASSLSLPQSLKSIGKKAFYLCSGLTSIIIPNSVETIGEAAFYQCCDLASVKLPDQLKSIASQLFRECSKLESVVIPENVERVCEMAFNSCDKLQSVAFPASLKAIDYDAFNGCHKLQTIDLPEKLQSIGSSAFENCISLSSIHFPDNLKTIGQRAFYGCSKLTTAYIPNCVTTIGSEAYEYCESLSAVTVPASVKIISGKTFQFCRKLKEVKLTDGLLSIGDNAFECCDSLASIVLPNSLTFIGDSAFFHCSRLQKVTFSDQLTTIGKSAFRLSNLSQVTLPAGLKAIGEKAFYEMISLNKVTMLSDKPMTVSSDIFNQHVFSEGKLYVPHGTKHKYQQVSAWNDFTNIFCKWKDEETGVVYEYDEDGTIAGVEGYDFAGVTDSTKLDLKILPSFTVEGKEYTVTYIAPFAFYGCEEIASVRIPDTVTRIDEGAFYVRSNLERIYMLGQTPATIEKAAFSNILYENAVLYVPIGSSDSYKNASYWSGFSNIVETNYAYASVSCQCLDEVGTDVTGNVTISWTDKDGHILGTGNNISGYLNNHEVYYSIQLNNTMDRLYHEIQNKFVSVKGDTTIVVQLKKFKKVELSGRVDAVDIDHRGATVFVKQLLNGKYEETYTTQTNEQGEFKLTVYDEKTDITVSRNDCFDEKLYFYEVIEDKNIDVVRLGLLSGRTIPTTITVFPAIAEGEENQEYEWQGDLNDLQFTITNSTTNTIIQDFVLQQDGRIIIKSGIDNNDVINIHVEGKNNEFEATDVSFGLSVDNKELKISLTETGGFDATYTESDNPQTVGYLYDSNGNLVARGNYVGDTLSMRHIPTGEYKLVSMGMNSLLGNISSLSQLSAYKFKEGRDYVLTSFDISSAEVKSVPVSKISRFDDTSFYYNGYYNANKADVTPGSLVTMSAHVLLNEEDEAKTKSLTLSVEIPEDCQFVVNSAIINRKSVPYTLDANTLRVTLSKEQAQEKLLFTVIPQTNKVFRSTAYVSFDENNSMLQPIGVAQFEANDFLINVPSFTNTNKIWVNGVANPNCEVRIYDNDVFIGSTISNDDGTLHAMCELYKANYLSYHHIYAKIRTSEGYEVKSNTRSIEYNRNFPTPESVSMTFYNGYHNKNITVDFNFQTGETSVKHYDFSQETDFTFITKFTDNNPEIIDDVNFIVQATDGTLRILPALFDSKQQAWVATSKYNSNKLPQNVTVDYVCLHAYSDDDRDAMFLDQATHLAAAANHIHNYFQDHAEVYLIDETSDMALLGCNIDGNNYLNYRIENIDFASAQELMKKVQFDYFTTEDGDMGEYVEIEDHSITITVVDLAENKAYRLTLLDPYDETGYAKWQQADAGPRKINRSYYSNGGYLAEFGEFAGALGTLAGISDYISVKSDFETMQENRKTYLDSFNKTRDNTVKKMAVKCPDGTPRLTKQTRAGFIDKWNTILAKEKKFEKKYDKYVSEYKKKLAWSLGTFVGTSLAGMGLNALSQSSKFIGSEVNNIFKSMLSKNVSAKNSAKIFANHMGVLLDCIIEETERVTDYKNFNKVRDRVLSWSYDEHAKITREYISLNKQIEKAYTSCKKENTPEKRNDTDGKQEIFKETSNVSVVFVTPPVVPILDPSGFVYEAVPSNRLPGVTTTVYQKQQGRAVKWNAEAYSQKNPLVTGEDGFYRWDVPQGEWQVKYEKDGYETCYSEWLPVPPPQLDVNVGMRQTTSPVVKQIRGMESGISIEMSKYMLPETLNEQNIIVKKDNVTIKGRVEMLNNEQSPAGDVSYVSKMKFVPEDLFQAGDKVYVTVKGDVESYCGVKMGTDHMEEIVIEPEISAIILDSVLTVPYEGSKSVQVVVMPQHAAAGKVLTAHLSSDMIASVANNSIVVDENGIASLILNGDLPGGTLLTLSMENSDLSAQSRVRVDVEYEVASTPTSSIRNGDQVEKGTMLTLTCATEGATIYYTLDGSCPCNEATRIRYTGPFTLPEGVVMVKAIAVSDYLYDSDVATFIYQVSSQTGINNAVAESHHFSASYSSGNIVIEEAEGADCKIYSLAGIELNGKASLNRYEAIPVSKSDIYIIYLKFVDGKTAVRKVLRQ